MKIVILNDTHAGVRNGSDIFLNEAERFYSKVLFPYMEKNQIKRIIHLGDYYDHRKFINFKVISRDKEMFLSQLEKYEVTMDIIPGNHDVYYKNTNSLCSLKEILQSFSSRVNVHMNPVTLEYDSFKIGLVPWISPENEMECMNYIASSDASVLMGHFNFGGFQMMKGGSVSHGLDTSIVSKYEMVLSGHFHTKSSKDNVFYLGTQYQTMWSDCNDSKFFHVFDTETRELTSVANTNVIFHRIVYDDTDAMKDMNWLSRFDFSYVKDSFVKIVVRNKGNPIIFDKFVEKIQREVPFEIKIVESFSEFTSTEVSDNLVSLEDTGKLLNTYIEAVQTDLDKEKLKKRLQELYVESQNFEIV
jgi:DNA repair exonuclease SbcCD nuclease subunit